MSLNEIRKTLLEQDHVLCEKISNEIKPANKDVLKMHIENLEDNEQEKCVYLGNGAFDVTMF